MDAGRPPLLKQPLLLGGPSGGPAPEEPLQRLAGGVFGMPGNPQGSLLDTHHGFKCERYWRLPGPRTHTHTHTLLRAQTHTHTPWEPEGFRIEQAQRQADKGSLCAHGHSI